MRNEAGFREQRTDRDAALLQRFGFSAIFNDFFASPNERADYRMPNAHSRKIMLLVTYLLWTHVLSGNP